MPRTQPSRNKEEREKKEEGWVVHEPIRIDLGCSDRGVSLHKRLLYVPPQTGGEVRE